MSKRSGVPPFGVKKYDAVRNIGETIAREVQVKELDRLLMKTAVDLLLVLALMKSSA